MRNVKVGPSPDWMVKRLNALGVRPHNNIVDITNYVMMLTGQPLHAFDLDTFAEREGRRRVVVRAAQQDEKFTTLDGEERTLDAAWASSPTASVPWRWPALWAAWIPRSRTTPST